VKASEIMSTDIKTIKRNTSIEEIAHILTENNISGLPVVDDDNIVIGMVTQKDLLYKDIEPRFPAVVEILGGLIFLRGVGKYREELRKVLATEAEGIMTRNVITVNEDTEVERIAQLMVEKDINRVPVLKDGRLTGIVSRADMVRYVAKTLE